MSGLFDNYDFEVVTKTPPLDEKHIILSTNVAEDDYTDYVREHYDLSVSQSVARIPRLNIE